MKTKGGNYLVDSDVGETIENVANVLEFLSCNKLEGEETAEIENGRHLILQCCVLALREVR